MSPLRPALLALLLAAGGAGQATADQKDPRLPALFDALAAAGSEAAAQPIEARIWAIWGEIGDGDDAALLARGTAAMNQGDGRTAAAAFDLLVAQAPDFAEGWNKRATLRYLLGDDAGSVADIRRTLALEPRHFGALSGLALIQAREERPDEAARSLAAALAIDPYLAGGQDRLRELRAKAAGDPI